MIAVFVKSNLSVRSDGLKLRTYRWTRQQLDYDPNFT
jgi:hypothetical protein